MNNYKKYLPSKKFISLTLIIIILLGLFFTIKGLVFLIRENSTSGDNKKINTVVVGDLIQKDSNSNGIADWEEYLWGLNPQKNGPENKEFILAKKKNLSQSGEIIQNDDSRTITNNEILSRELFATIVSLQQTGDINDESIQSIASAIGEEVKANPIPSVYTKEDLTLKNDSEAANYAYYKAFEALVTKYEDRDIGSELTLISQGLGSNDPQALLAATTVAEAYRSFAKELVKIAVPISIYPIHLSLVNNYDKTGQSIDGLTRTLIDPIVGMKSLLNYKNYSDALVSDIEKLTEILQ